MRTAVANAPHGAASLVLHHTSSTKDGNHDHEYDDEDTKDSSDDISVDNFRVHEGRPDVVALVSARIRSSNGRMLVAGTLHCVRIYDPVLTRVYSTACGPDSLTIDVRKAVTHAQIDILKKRINATEVVLHTEAFDW